MSVLVLASLVAVQAPVTLLYQPKVGSTIKYSTSTVQSSPMMGGTQTTSMVSTMKVVSMSGGYYKIDSATSNVKITGGMGGDQMQKALEGKHQMLTIDKYGSPKLDAKDMSPGMQQMMKGFGGQSTGVLFPKKPVKVGESWSNSIDLGDVMNGAAKASKAQGMKGSGKMTTSYKLVKVDGNTATLSMSISGKMDMDMSGMGGPKSGAGAGQSMKMSMTMGGSGQTIVDRATGTIVNSSMKMNMSVMGQNMTISTNVKKI